MAITTIRNPGAVLAAGMALAIAGAAAVAVATAGSARAQNLAPLTFTTQQANAGADVYRSSCAPCHGDALQGAGGPRLVGPGFDRLGRPVGALFTFISENMPADYPGGLTPAQYLNVVAFIARSNGFTAGPTALPADVELLNAMAFRQ